MCKENEAAETNKLCSAQQAEPDHHWRLFDLLMMCQYANVSQWTQNELRMSKIRQGVSDHLKIRSKPCFFGNISLRWIIPKCSWKPICSLVLWPNCSVIFFWRTVSDFCRLFGFFCHQRYGFWIRASDIEWQFFLLLFLKALQ